MQPTLSLAMMVRDEEEMLEEALLSVRDLVDEMIVMDTGSEDRTVEIARDLGATVSFFEWCDSFSAARNETLKRATGDWVFVLDADERVKGGDRDALHAMLRPSPHFPFQAFLVNVLNVSVDGEPLSSAYGPRVFPNDRRLGYSGLVHNQLGPLDPADPPLNASYLEDLEIIHLGYDETVYARRRKSERSLPLIEQALREQPDDLAMHLYLGREQMRLQRFDQASVTLLATVERMCADSSQDNLLQAAWCNLLDARRLARLDIQQTIGLGAEGLRRFPKNSDLWSSMAAVLIEGGKPEEAIRCLLQAKASLDHAWAMDKARSAALRPWDLDERLGLAYADAGRYEEAYRSFSEAIRVRPESSPGWVEALEATCALAQKVGDEQAIPALQARLEAFNRAADATPDDSSEP